MLPLSTRVPCAAYYSIKISIKWLSRIKRPPQISLISVDGTMHIIVVARTQHGHLGHVLIIKYNSASWLR